MRIFITIKRALFFLVAGATALLSLPACHGLSGENPVSRNAIDGDAEVFIVSAEDGSLSEEVRSAYRHDAEVLAVRHIIGQDPDQIEIPPLLTEALYNGLIHIVNSDEEAAVELTEKHPVHAANPAPRRLLVFADSTADWLSAWRKGETLTGQEAIDALIDEYDFRLAAFNETGSVMGTLRSGRPLNLEAVGRRFEEVATIVRASPDNLLVSKSDIRVLFFADRLRYTFEYGFGDCLSGCMGHHYWKVDVYTGGTVKIIEEGGNALPDPSGFH